MATTVSGRGPRDTSRLVPRRHGSRRHAVPVNRSRRARSHTLPVAVPIRRLRTAILPRAP